MLNTVVHNDIQYYIVSISPGTRVVEMSHKMKVSVSQRVRVKVAEPEKQVTQTKRQEVAIV